MSHQDDILKGPNICAWTPNCVLIAYYQPIPITIFFMSSDRVVMVYGIKAIFNINWNKKIAKAWV